jgi:FtsH-binding integral membrane protein
MTNNSKFDRTHTPVIQRAIEEAAVDVGLRAYMIKVYNYMMAGLAITGVVSFLTASSPDMMHAIYATPLRWVVMLAPLGFVFFLSYQIDKIQSSTAQVLFWIYAALMGLSLSFIFMVYQGESIARVFFITAATFGSMSLYGYTTQRDLTGFGSFLFMGLIGIIIASIVNIFMASSALQFAISVIGVLIFTGLTAYDTQKIKNMYQDGLGTETTTKMAVMGALNLYLDFINLFLMLLRLFGDRR